MSVFQSVFRGDLDTLSWRIPLYEKMQPEYFEKEREKIFSRSWLRIGRMEDLPEKGSYFVFDVPTLKTSLIVTRDGDPLTDRKGRRSYVTSAGAGPSLGKFILMSYLPPEHAVEGSQDLAVVYMNERYPVTVDIVGARAPFDPDNERIRA